MTTTKKTFKQTLFGKILIGIGDGFTGGSISNVVYADETQPANKPDAARLIVSIAIASLTILFALNKITFEQFENLLKLLQ